MATPGRIDYVSGGEQSALLNNLFANPITVRAFDAGGNPMPAGEPMVFGLAVSGASGTFHPSGIITNNQVTDSGGYVTCDSIRANSILGTWTGAVQFVNALGISGGFFNLKNVDVMPVATSIAILNGDNQMRVQSDTFTAITVKAKDQFNAGLPNVTIRFGAPAGRGAWVGGGTFKDVPVGADGNATSPQFVANATLGALPITITINGTSVTTTVNWNVVSAATPTAVNVQTGSGQTQAVSTLFTKALVAKVTNALGDPLSGVSVLFTSPPTGASCGFPAVQTNTAVTNASGLATSTVNPTSNAIVGSYQVTAEVTGVVAKAAFSLTNGFAYLPEVCTPYIPLQTGANQGANVTPWTNPQRAVDGNATGAQLTTVSNTSNKQLTCTGVPLSSFDDVDDLAKFSRFVLYFEYKWVTTNLNLNVTISDSGGGKITSFNANNASANGVYFAQALSLPQNTGPAITGASMKAQAANWQVTFSPAQTGPTPVLNVRNVKLAFCYQNPDYPPPQIMPPLLMCEA